MGDAALAGRARGAARTAASAGDAARRGTRILIALAVLCICAGAAFRVWRLDGPVFSSDETVAEQHVAGYVEPELLAALGHERPIRAADALRFVTPAAGRSARDVVRVLAAEDPQHPPLFYVAERWWMLLAGASPAAARALPACFGLLGIAAAGWLCALVTRSAVGGWAGAAFFALSPFEVIYAQQVREYSLFATLTMASTALLLAAARKPRLPVLAAYAVLATAGMYTFSLFGLVLGAHATIVSFERPARGTGRRLAAAIAVALLAWLPWALVLLRGRAVIGATNDWSATRWSPAALLAKWLYNATISSFDLIYLDARWAPAAALVLLVIALALWELRRAQPRARAVVWALLGWCFGALAAADLIAGGHRSTVARYVVPAFCALVVALAAWFCANWERGGRRRAVAASAGLLLCGLAVASLSVRASRGVWWDNAKEGAIRPIAAALDGSRLPVLVTDVNWPILIELSRYARTDPTFVLVPANRLEPVVASAGPALVVTTSLGSRREVASSHRVSARVVRAFDVQSAPVALFRKRLVAGSAGADPTDVDDSHAALLRVAPLAPLANRART